jgi:hypothetical protein
MQLSQRRYRWHRMQHIAHRSNADDQDAQRAFSCERVRRVQ